MQCSYNLHLWIPVASPPSFSLIFLLLVCWPGDVTCLTATSDGQHLQDLQWKSCCIVKDQCLLVACSWPNPFTFATASHSSPSSASSTTYSTFFLSLFFLTHFSPFIQSSQPVTYSLLLLFFTVFSLFSSIPLLTLFPTPLYIPFPHSCVHQPHFSSHINSFLLSVTFFFYLPPHLYT